MAGNKRDHDLVFMDDKSSTDDPLVTVSVLVPGEDAQKYLMQRHGDRGWWMPFGRVLPNETIKVCAQRVASEVGLRAKTISEESDSQRSTRSLVFCLRSHTIC